MISRRAFLRFAAPVLAARGRAHSEEPNPVATWELTALSGEAVSWRPGPKGRVVVFAFLGADCPISNRAQPELSRLARELSPDVEFVPVYPNAGEDADAIRRHRTEYQLTPVAYRDPKQRLADALQVGVTPEVVALTAGGRLIYRGRINDQFGGLGRGRPEPTRHDLAEALGAFLAGSPPAGRVTPAVGCRIDRAS
ncbi:MAG: hypothetical protein KIT22_00205 [Verrucomicrobiae bacterium]|nr:hypothetical protein [Verrucomicrobiae bacterium]